MKTICKREKILIKGNEIKMLTAKKPSDILWKN